ncbi:MAG: hypothetical protein KAR73_10305 [Spirochaetales bacterium]|nr:hypothetical protein [Spirochaetales bacterium]
MELAERIEPDKLADAANSDTDNAYMQRTGYILDNIGMGDRALRLAELVNEQIEADLCFSKRYNEIWGR